MFSFPSLRRRPSRRSSTRSSALQRRPRLELLDDRITPTVSSIASNFNGTAIRPGSTLWFNSVFKVSGMGSEGATLFVTHGNVSSSAFNVATPDAVITFSPTATSATTSFNAGNNTWYTTVPLGLSGNTYLDGAALGLPNGLPGGLNPVTWSADFMADRSGLTVNWQWSAAVYRSFSADYSQLGVKPVDSNSASQWHNSDHAGTPENYKSFVTGGARGGGGSNFTGSNSATGHVSPNLCEPPGGGGGGGGTATLGGTIFQDVAGPDGFDGIQQPWEMGIEGVEVRLTGMDNLGHSVSLVTYTDADGHYGFTGLAAGTYQLFEVQPEGYLDGLDSVGTVGGQSNGTLTADDTIGQIVLGDGSQGIDYNFAEIFISHG